MDDDEMRRRVAEAPVARLGTVGAGGRPHLVPCCFVLDGDTLYTPVDDVKTKSTRALRRLANIADNPRVTLLVDHYEPDWSALWWVRVDGHATVLEPDSLGHRGAAVLLRSKYDQYADATLDGPMIRVGIDTWRSWP